ncbi:MAG: polyketide synthase, partial [Deltaproteobacteria bacterium]|nr:polyketide synthase [Deltaproteobacteria bacterium]
MKPNANNINIEPIAIVGASCRFPGQVVDLDSFWKLLSNGIDAISSVPQDRFSTERFCSASKTIKGRSYVSAAGVVDGLKYFDAEFFGMSKIEAESLDPQQRMALELAWEALEQAHILPSSIRGTRAGVFIGASLPDIMLIGANDIGKISPYSISGSCLSIIPNRVSHFFDLHGPSMAIDTACSSSLVAVHEACKELRSGKIPLALAGGTHAIFAPFAFVGFSRARMLSPDGRCKPFDAKGNGYVRGEGAGMLVLKTLTAAQKDGDDILGLIVASNVNSDGHTLGLALPNVQAQVTLLKDTYNEFQLDKNKLVYFEAHGTGTAVGDPVEADAIGKILGKSLKGVRPLFVGSVKSNIGHLEPASGIAGLIKSLLIF